MSDGLRSLFSLSLTLGLFAVEQKIRKNAEKSGFKSELAETLPSLTIFAVEEPENHLSPHYLGHVVGQLEEISKNASAQVLVSSHSPSILARVQPDNVRYFRGNEESVNSSIISLPLPKEESDESYKYIREAIRGYPELYFSNIVILCEGPSEEIVLKRIFEASGTPLDTHFISLTPLGGRHVNHFWRLLDGLGIKYLTLLDLDREKEGAGWGRIKYVRDQLIKIHGKGSSKLKFTYGNSTKIFCLENYDNFDTRDVTDVKKMSQWLKIFQKNYDVFFSNPLDLDLSMLESFTKVYQGLVESPNRGPNLPKEETPEFKKEIENRVKQVLAKNDKDPQGDLGSTYTEEQKKLFPWYQYLFLNDSKPVTHFRAMLKVDSEDLITNLPNTLTELVNRVKQLLNSSDSDLETPDVEN